MGEPGKKPLTYADSGVDIKRKDAAARTLVDSLTFSRKGPGAPLAGIGHFAGLIDFPGDFALVMCTDGVGTKLEIANAMKKWDTVGIDCIAMNVNDAICVGAEPIAFVDYLAVEDASPEFTRQIGIGLAKGAEESNVSIVGGETAILPSLVKGFDIAGTCLAYVRKDRIITGDAIRPGDVIIGCASSGVHSNGFTLVRRVFSDAGIDFHDEVWDGRKLGDELLTPTRLYVKPVMELLGADVDVHGISHVTGSGILNLPRLSKEVKFVLTDPMPVPRILRVVQEKGGIETGEMYRTFNMGMGLAIVVAPEHVDDAIAALSKHVDAKVVGHVEEGFGVAVPSLGIDFAEAKF